jgi:hypothetical protein
MFSTCAVCSFCRVGVSCCYLGAMSVHVHRLHNGVSSGEALDSDRRCSNTPEILIVLFSAPFKSQWPLMYHPGEDLKVQTSAHRAHFCFVFTSKLAATTSLYSVDLLGLLPRRCVFTARYEQNLLSPFHVKHLSFVPQAFAGLLPRSTLTDPCSVHVRIMVDRVELGQIFLLGF